MSRRELLQVDGGGRVSVGRLGLSGSILVADQLEDGTGWVIRTGRLLTDAELDVLSSPGNVAAIGRAALDAAAGRTQPRRRRGSPTPPSVPAVD